MHIVPNVLAIGTASTLGSGIPWRSGGNMELTEYIDKGLVHSIHTSERKSFRSCRRRWDWTSRQMYYPRTTPAPLEFGVAFHAAMEKFYEPTTWHMDISVRLGLAIVEFQRTCNEQRKTYKLLNGDLDDKLSLEY